MFTDAFGKTWYKGNLHTHTTNSDGAYTPEETIALYKSKGHRDNILNPNFEYVGIGCLITDLDVDEDGIASIECYWTQEFYR